MRANIGNKTILWIIITILALSCNPSTKEQNSINYESKIDSLIQLMTLEEKVNMIHASSSFTSGGVERLGVPELIMSDGPHGVRHEHGRDWSADDTDSDYVTYLPTGITLASTWNTDLGYQFGKVLGNEAKARGKDMILGPGINIIRSPLNGRNFEYLSEDPYLTAQMAVGYIKGVQDQGIAACAKHFVANNQETLRNSVDVQVDERALREIYLPAFKASVQKADVYSIMGAYNKFRGQYCSHHEYLVNKVLKDEFGFNGFLVSDWSAVMDTKEALLYGTDIEMGSDLSMTDIDYNKFYLADPALEMVKSGEISEDYVDEKVRRILRVMFKINLFGEREQGKVNTREHQELALKVAEEGIVLLKNEKLLPFNENKLKKVAVIGANGKIKHAELGGSSQVKALYEITPFEGIEKYLGENVEVVYAQGYKPTKENIYNKKLADEAIQLALESDAVIFVGGWIHNLDENMWSEYSYDCEGKDKTDLKLMYGQEELINQLAKANSNFAVVIMGGSNVEMNGWLPNVKSVLHAWYPGMEGGTAIANILFGKTNPSGKLPVTFANSHLDYPSHIEGEFPGVDSVVHYNEGIMVGYRYFTTNAIKPLFPFGHGLSYTSFDYKSIDAKLVDDNIFVKVNIENTGEMDGAEIVQCYISKKESKYLRPKIELKGFKKEYILKGEEKRAQISINKNDLSVFDISQNKWILEPGEYTIEVGSSSEDIRLITQIEL